MYSVDVQIASWLIYHISYQLCLWFYYVAEVRDTVASLTAQKSITKVRKTFTNLKVDFNSLNGIGSRYFHFQCHFYCTNKFWMEFWSKHFLHQL